MTNDQRRAGEAMQELSKAVEALNITDMWLDNNHPWRLMVSRGSWNLALAEQHPEHAPGDGEWADGKAMCDIVNAAIRLCQSPLPDGGGDRTGAGVEGAVLTAPGSRGPNPQAVSASGFDPSRGYSSFDGTYHSLPEGLSALEWKLSEETRAHLREIDDAILKPGDPRLDQTMLGPAGPAAGYDGYGSQARPLPPAPGIETGTATTEGCGPKDESPVAAGEAPSVPSHPPGQAVSQSIAGEDDLRAAMVTALDGHTRWSRDCHLDGEYLCGKVWPLVQTALARSPAAGAGRDLQLALTKLYRHALNCPGAEYDEDGIENALRILSAALAPAPSPQGEGWQPIGDKLKDAGGYSHLPDGESAGFGWYTDIDDRLLFLLWWADLGHGRSKVTHWRPPLEGPSPAPAQKG